MNDSVHIFLGANSGEGFASLYGQLIGRRFDDLLILKGGPGCGKSSFMRTVAKRLSGNGEETIYVNCSGDPDSLDAVLFPRIKAGVVDGTAPHVLEPSYTVAHERYVDLTRFYDVAAVKEARCEIAAHTDAYRAAYVDAYRALRAAEAVAGVRRAEAAAAMDFDKLARRLENAARQELRGGGNGHGRLDRAFLGGVTHKGELCRFDTVEALCPRVYALSDSHGLAAAALARVSEAAARSGYDVLAGMNPDRPGETRHVLIPARGVAFVTSSARAPYPGKAYRHIRVDAMAYAAISRTQRAKLRFTGRVEDALRGEAVEALARAKSAHDALEAAYNPCVDFDGVYALAEQEAERLAASPKYAANT